VKPTAHLNPTVPTEQSSAAHKIESLVQGYAPGQDVPLAAYATLIGIFGSMLAVLLASRKTRERAPDKVPIADVVLLGAAAHRLSRVVSSDRVTAAIRAPFTRYVDSPGGGEVEEEPRGKGFQKAVGQLLTCRFCVGPWIAMALVSGLTLRPRATRIVSALFAVSAVSDFIHRAYARVRQ
jgi:hypothetical protein